MLKTAATQRAMNLRSWLKQQPHLPELSHDQALHVQAQMYGHRTWHHMLATLQNPVDPWNLLQASRHLNRALQQHSIHLDERDVQNLAAQTHVLSPLQTLQVLLSGFPERLRKSVWQEVKGLEMLSTGMALHLNPGSEVLAQDQRNHQNSVELETSTVSQQDVHWILRHAPPFLSHHATWIPGTLTRITYTDDTDVSIYMHVHQRVVGALQQTEKVQQVILLPLHSVDEAHHDVVRSVIQDLSGRGDRVLVLDPVQRITATSTDTTAFAPRALAACGTSWVRSWTIDPVWLVELVKTLQPTTVCFVAGTDKDFAAVQAALEAGLRVVFHTTQVNRAREFVQSWMNTKSQA